MTGPPWIWADPTNIAARVETRSPELGAPVVPLLLLISPTVIAPTSECASIIPIIALLPVILTAISTSPDPVMGAENIAALRLVP